MNKDNEEYTKILKALSDSNRLQIIDLLSCGEKCACELLHYFNITQPTLSHHMKVLIDCGVVETRKEGTWNYYNLNNINVNKFLIGFMGIVLESEKCKCICSKIR